MVDDHDVDSPNVRTNSSANTVKRNHLVIADDDSDLRDWLTLTLRADGYEVTEVTSGESLMELLGSALSEPSNVPLPAAIVADIQMEGFSGLQVLSALEEGALHVPFIIMTALDDPKLKRTAERCGAAAFLHKPLDTKNLLDVVRRFVKPDYTL